MTMSASVQGITNLTVDLIVRSVQQLSSPVQSNGGGVDAPTTQLATPNVDAHHVDVTA
jgi:hypothetical protein